MPVATLMVPPIMDSVSTSLARGLGQEYLTRLGVQGETNTIVQPKVGHPITAEGTQDKLAELKTLPPLDTDQQLTINMTEEFTEEGLLHNATYRPEWPYIFRDDKVGLKIRPSYAFTRLTLEFRFQFRHESQARRIVRTLRQHGGLHSIPNTHRVYYQYGLPDSLQVFLYDVHQMRESVGQYGQTLQEYLHGCFRDGVLGSRKTQDGETYALAINETQHDCTALFESEIYYQAVESLNAGYVVGFTMTLEYQQIMSVVAFYPVYIHNQRIDQMYLNMWQAPQHRNLSPTEVLSYIEPPKKGDGTPYYYAGDGGYRLDPVDDWFPRQPGDDTLTQVLTPIQVSMGDPTLLCNLHDFTEEQLPSFIKDVILAFPDKAVIPYELPYLVQVFKVCGNEQLVTIVIHPNGDIRSVIPLDITCRHYVRISVLTDLSRLDLWFVKWVVKYPHITHQMFEHIHPPVTMDEDKDWLETANGQWVTLPSYERTLGKIPTTAEEFRKKKYHQPLYSQYGTITTHRTPK